MEEKKISIEVTPEIAGGVYSNMAMINHSSSEFVLDYIQMMPGAKPRVVSRVILTPEHAKRLLGALKDNITKYEKENGEIVLRNAPQAQMMPPVKFGGEA